MIGKFFSRTTQKKTSTMGAGADLDKDAKRNLPPKRPQSGRVNRKWHGRVHFVGNKPKEPFPNKDAGDRIDILVRGLSFHNHLFTTLATDENASVTISSLFHGVIRPKALSLPGFLLLNIGTRDHFSRMRNFEADAWRHQSLERADAYMYQLEIKNLDEYLSKPGTTNHFGITEGWESDRNEISRLLCKPSLMENPTKPLLVLVNIQGSEQSIEDFDVGRMVHLWGLERLTRPFRILPYSDIHDLKEALEWTATKVRSNTGDEVTAVTECETEEENSIVTSNTAFSSTDAYVLDYEPTLLGGNATLQRFEPIKNGTHCPFARAAKLWGGKLADETIPRLMYFCSIDHAASLNAGPLMEFVARVSDGEFLDGFCLEIPECHWMEPEPFGKVVCKLLTKFAELDPTPGENAMTKMGPIDSPRWRFRFAGEDFFLTTFSSKYDENSSRCAFDTRRAFILFQPLTSFGRHGLTHDTPASATQWDNPTSMRDKARVAFKKAGCPYHIPDELPYPVAEHIVKPEKDDGKTVIRWWDKAGVDAANWAD